MAVRHIGVNNNSSFRAGTVSQEFISAQTRIIYDQQPDAFIKEAKTDGTTKVAIGIGAAIVAGIGALAYIKKGKGVKSVKPVGEALKQITDQTCRTSSAIEPKKIITMSISDFKKSGVFKDGKALIDGKGFTGIIEVCKEKGTKKIYENGILKTAFRNGNQKMYQYDKSGKLTKIVEDVVGSKDIDTKIFKVNSDGSKSVISKIFTPNVVNTKNMEIKYYGTEKRLLKDGTIQKVKLGRAEIVGNNPNTKGRIYSIARDESTGKIVRVNKLYAGVNDKKLVSHVGNPLNYTRKQEIVDGKKITKFYDNAGELSHITKSSYNPQTGIFVKEKEDVLNEVKTVFVTDRKSNAEFSILKDKNGAIQKVTKKISGGSCIIQGSNLDKNGLVSDLFSSGANSDFGKACIAAIN